VRKNLAGFAVAKRLVLEVEEVDLRPELAVRAFSSQQLEICG
jgi:hypothetical protein